jgi:hypothetical protein
LSATAKTERKRAAKENVKEEASIGDLAPKGMA